MAAALTTAADYADADKRALASARRKFIIGRVLSYAVLAIAVLLVLFPIYWMIITSLKLPREIFRLPSLWPQVFTLNNYRQAARPTAAS